ncbi:MAG: YlxR family protein [Desertifilum sp.]|nr:YlxR family protein [Desertifilum sp.]
MVVKNYRRCISCRKLAPKDAFWRVVRVHPEGQIQFDEGMGRSAYLCPTADCLRVAQKKNRLGRSLKAAVAPIIYQALWQRLAEPQASPPPASDADLPPRTPPLEI